MSQKRLLKTRTMQKKKKPEFKRYCWNKKRRLREKSWRRPRGLHSKLRRRYGGKWSGRVLVSVGFGSPREVRGLHPSGFTEILVFNPNDLEGIDPNTHAIRISARVGTKKRLAIEEKAKELGIKILNPLKVM